MMSTAATLAGRDPRAARALVLEDPPSRSRDDLAATVADGIEADARLVRSDASGWSAASATPTRSGPTRTSSTRSTASPPTPPRWPPDRFVVLDGGHCLHRDLPARWVEEVGGFADTVQAGAERPGRAGGG
jgi:hypothetical protein